MSLLRRRMIEDMTVRNLSPYTQRNYLFAVSRLARHSRMSPAELGPEQLRDYLNHLVGRNVSSSYFNVNVAALRFLYMVVLERDWMLPKLPLQRRSHKLPTVLSVEEVGRFLATVPDRKMRAVLVTAYAAGLRVLEVVALRVSDVDSARMTLRVADGKGGKARLVMLPPKLLDLLRTYWKAERPRAEWLFPSRDPAQHVSIRSVQLACQTAREAAGIGKHVTMHTLRHSFAPSAAFHVPRTRNLLLLRPPARSRHRPVHHQAAARPSQACPPLRATCTSPPARFAPSPVRSTASTWPCRLPDRGRWAAWSWRCESACYRDPPFIRP